MDNAEISPKKLRSPVCSILTNEETNRLAICFFNFVMPCSTNWWRLAVLRVGLLDFLIFAKICVSNSLLLI